jgi:plasmid maintenance system antidote protein VapI
MQTLKGNCASFRITNRCTGRRPAPVTLRLQLAALDTAQSLDDMDVPGYRLSPESWLAMQHSFDLWLAKKTADLSEVQKVQFEAA